MRSSSHGTARDQKLTNMGCYLHKALPPLFATVSLGLSAVANAQTIEFAAPALEPYGFLQQNDRREFGPGALPEIAGRIGQVSGLDIRATVLPIKRVNKQLFQGGSHCTILLQTAFRKKNLEQIAEVQASFPSVIVTRLGFNVGRVAELRGHVLSIPRGSYNGYAIAEDPLIRRQLSNGYAQSVRLLKAGRVDAIAGTALSIFFNLSRHGMQRHAYGSVTVFDNTPLWLQCRRRALPDATLERLRRATEVLRAAGAFEKILQHYSGGYTFKKGS